MNYLLKKPLIKHDPQREFLGLISTGNKYAVASRGRLALEGKFLWRLKDAIDRGWMEGYQKFDAMEDDSSSVNPSSSSVPGIVAASGIDAMMKFKESDMRCGGCGAKVGSRVLGRVLKAVRERSDRQDEALRQLQGGEAEGPGSNYKRGVLSEGNMDDCAICPPPPPGSRLVHTIDFFRSFITDPFVFGRVSAIHALSDCHAMGAYPQTALALAVAPYAANDKITEDVLVAMLSGANDALKEDGCELVGGHTCEGAELSLGFSVNGYIPSSLKPLMKTGGQPGDGIILTKKIGTGALFASEMRRKCEGSSREEAILSMCISNGRAGRIIVEPEFSVRAATDVTGFGLIGHLVEMLGEDGVVAELKVSSVPFLRGAMEAASAGIFSSLQKANENSKRAVDVDAEVLDRYKHEVKLLYDPQTSGGLLIICPQENIDKLLQALRVHYPDSAVIGRLVTSAVAKKGGEADNEAEGRPLSSSSSSCSMPTKLVRLQE